MLRSQYPRHAIQRVNLALHPGKRPFSFKRRTRPLYPPQGTLPSVRVLGPTLWCFGVAGIIYMGCATYESYQEIQDRKRIPLADKWTNLLPYSSSTPKSKALDNFTSAEKAMTAIGALNIGIFGLQHLGPGAFSAFAHMPTENRNFTMLTSMFGHSGIMHLGLNMYGLLNFGPPVAEGPTFMSSGSHLTAFYLSAGLFASLAQHLKAAVPRNVDRIIPALGASGGIMALLGIWGMNNPEKGIGIIFVPGSLPAQDALMCLVAFETWGTVFGYSFIKFGHAAHLTGLLAGMAYVHFDGRKRLWQPTKRLALNSMKKLNIV